MSEQYIEEDLDSNLEAPVTDRFVADSVYKSPPKNRYSLLKYNRRALALVSGILGLILLVGLSSYLLVRSPATSSSADRSSDASKFNVGIIPLANSGLTALKLGQAERLSINGQLEVRGGLVLTPGTAPQNALPGQFYYDQATQEPYYYNGTAFVPLVETAALGVSSIGGANGIVGLGNGLQLTNGQIRLTDAILQAATAIGATGGLVSSVQGQTGAVSFSGGNGIAVNGTAITNTGLLSLGGSAGNLGLGRGLSIQAGALRSTVSLVSGSANLVITDDANGNYTITDTIAANNVTPVTLGPVASQVDNSTEVSIDINKTATGNFLQLASNGVNQFVINQAGAITTGTIAYTQVTGAPVTTVTSLGGSSGAISLGSGLAISSNVLSNTGVTSFGGTAGAVTVGSGLGYVGNSLTNAGVVSIIGTANQINASVSTGNVTLSLPQDIAPTSNPTFNNQTLNGSLAVNANTTLSGLLGVTGAANFSSTANVTGSATFGSTLTATGAVNLNSTLTVANTTTLNGTVVNGTATLGSTLAVAGATTLAGTLGVAANATFGSNVLVQGGNLTLGVASTTSGAVTFANSNNNNLTTFSSQAPTGLGVASIFIPSIAGGSSDQVCLLSLGNCVGSGTSVTASGGVVGFIPVFDNTQNITSSVIYQAGTSVGVNTSTPGAFALNVQGGNVNFSGSATVGTGLSVAGTANLSSTLTVAGITTLNGNTSVTGVGTLTVGTGATILGGSLAVTGNTSFAANVTAAGAVTISSLGVGLVQSNASGLLSSATVDRNSAALLTNNLNVANGGTGASTAAGARTNLGAAAAGANSDITSISGLSTALSAGQGGTGRNGATAANGSLLIGNGTGYTLANLTQGSGISITNGAGAITIAIDNTVCTTNGNCAGAGTGVTTAGGTTGTIALFTGTQAIGDSIISQTGTVISVAGTLTATALQGNGSGITDLNASALTTGTVASGRLTGAYSGITGTGALSAGSITTGFGSISTGNGITTTAALQGNSLSIGGGTFTVNATGAITAATGLTSSGTITLSSLNSAGVVKNSAGGILSTGTVALGTETTGNYVALLGTLTGLTTTGNTGAGSTPTLAVTYGSTANTAAQGNTAFTFTPATGNLTGSLSGTAGAGFTSTTLSVVNNPTFSGLVTANGGLTVANATTFINAGATLNTAVNITNLVTGGAIGTAASTVDSATTFNISQTTGAQTLSLPFPTTVTAGRIAYINNVGTAGFSMSGNSLPAGQSAAFQWNGGTWVAINNPVAGSGLAQSGNVLTSAAATSVTNDTNITGSIAGNVLTLGYTGTLSVARGGTGASNATDARTNLGAAASGANADIISLSATTSVGNTGAALTLQGNASSVFAATAGSFTTSVGFASPTANVSYQFQAAAAGAYNICTTAGNCTGTGGGVTTAGGTIGTIAKFTGAQTVGNSLLSETGSTVTVGGALAVNTIAPTTAFLLGVTSQNVTVQGAAVAISSTNGTFTNTLNFATPAGSSKTITLPNANGTVAVSASGPLAIDANGNISCATCATSGGGAGAAVDSINAINGVVTLQGTSNQIIISNNTGTRTITVSTPQDINTSSSPTFSSANLTNTLTVTNAITAGSLVSGGTLTVTGAATAASFNGLNLTANATGFTVAGGTAVRTVTVTANATIDQNISTTSTPSFAGLTLGTALSVANGGTGATTAGAARTNLGAAASGANSDITSITGLTTALSAGQGGTGINGSIAANGKLLIGNGTGYTLANLTQGSGISITNGAGSISIAVDNTICTTSGNCSGAGAGVTTAGGTVGTISLFTGAQAIGNSIITQSGTTITVAGTLAATALQGDGSAITGLNANNLASGTVPSARVAGIYSGITGTGTLTTGSISTGFGAISTANTITTTAALQGNTLSIGTGTFTINATGAITAATGITSSGAITFSSLNSVGVVKTNAFGVLSTGTVALGTETTGNYVATLGTLTGLTTTGNTGAGSTPTLSVIYGSTANTAAQGNTGLSFTGAGNLTGTVSGTAGGGFSTNTLAIVANPTFAGLVTANGGLTVTGTNTFTVGTGTSTLGGALAVAGTTTLSGVLNVSAGTGIVASFSGRVAGGNAVATNEFATLGQVTDAISSAANNYIANGTTLQTANFNIQSAAAASVGAVIRAATSQTANLIQFQGSTGTVLASVTAAGQILGTAGIVIQSGGFTFNGVGDLNVDSTSDTKINTGTATGNVLIGSATNTTTVNSSLTLNKTVTVAAGQTITLVGGLTATRPATPTEGMLYFDTTTKQLLVYANGKWQADRSTSTVTVGTSAVGGASGATASKGFDGADFVNTSTTSAQTVINAAIATLPATGGSIYLMEGTYIVDGSISLPNNTTLEGAGAGTVIKVKNAHNLSIEAITNSDTSTATGLTIQNLRIDGNRVNQTAGLQNGIYLVNMGGGTGAGARDGAKITNVTVRAMSNYGIFLYNSSNNTITGNTVQGNNNGVYLYYSSNNTITGNTVQGNNNGISVFDSSRNNTITGNTVQGNNYGIVIDFSTANTITGNTAQGNYYGISVLTSNNNTLSGNTIQGSNTGIYLYNSSNNTLTGNKLHDNGGTSSNNGIVMQASSNNTLTGNDITDTSCTTSCFAINISDDGSTSNYLANNRHSGTAANPSTINDVAPNTIYANQTDGTGNLVNRNHGGLTVGTTTATTTFTLQGSLTASKLTAPAAPTLAIAGTTGTTSRSYAVTALDGSGETLSSTVTTTTTSNATLTTANYVTINWTQVGGAVQYKIYRTASAGTPSTTGVIGTVNSNVFSLNDTGLAGNAAAVPTANTTGNASIAGNIQGSGNLNITGSSTIGGSLTLGTASTTSGSLTLANAGSAFTTTLQIAAPAQSTTLTIPASSASDTFCLQTLANCGSGVGGSGTANAVARFTGTSTLGTGQLFDNGSQVGVGTSSLDFGAFFRVVNTSAATSGGSAITISGLLLAPTFNPSTQNGDLFLVGSNLTPTYSGTISLFGNGSLTGQYINPQIAAGVISAPANVFGSDIIISNKSASATVTSASGIRVRTPLATGAITTAIGIEIQAQKTTGVTTGYGIYQSGAADLNYFAGNVGIGLTNPNESLTANGRISLAETTSPTATANFGKLFVKSSDSNLYYLNDGGVETQITGNTAAAGTLQAAYNVSANPELTLDATRGALTIRDAATPLNGNLLEVQNNAGSITYLKVAGSPADTTGTSGNGTNATTSLFSAAKGGNVTNALNVLGVAGIGGSLTISGGAGGNVASATATNGSGGNVSIQGGARGTGGTGGSFGNVILQTSGGNVGIGTSNPGSIDPAVIALEVNRSQNTASVIASVNTNTSNRASSGFAAYNQSDVTSLAYFGIGGTGYSDSPLLQDRGFVYTGSSTAGFVIMNEGAQPILFATSQTEIARFSASGNLGLGITAPAERLDVAGNISVNYNAVKLNGRKPRVVMISGTGDTPVTYNYLVAQNLIVGTIDSTSTAEQLAAMDYDVYMADSSNTNPGFDNAKLFALWKLYGKNVFSIGNDTNTLLYPITSATGSTTASKSGQPDKPHVLMQDLSGVTNIGTTTDASTQIISLRAGFTSLYKDTTVPNYTLGAIGESETGGIWFHDQTGFLTVSGQGNTQTVVKNVLAYMTGSDSRFVGARVSNSGLRNLQNVLYVDQATSRIGLGNTAPGYLLDVAGDINVRSGSSYRFNGVAGVSTTCTSGQVLQNQVTQGGIVTAGTCATTGTSTLQVAYTTSTGGTTPEVKLDATRGALDIQDADTTIGTTANLLAVRGSNSAGLGTVLFNVQGNGNVGIGTATPGSLSPSIALEVNRSQNGGSTIATINTNTGPSSSNGFAAYNQSNVSSLAYFGIGGTGGSSPLLQNKAFVYSGLNTTGISIVNEGAQPILFATSMSEIARFSSTGNLGLGSAGTDSKLHIQGSTDDEVLIVQGSSAQSVANILEIKNSGGSVLAALSSGGILKVGTVAAPTLSGAKLLVTQVEITTRLRIGDGTNGISYNDATSGKLRYNGTARNNKLLTLKPEFEGATFKADGTSNTGYFNSSFCSNVSGGLLVNSGTGNACANANDRHSYYEWTTSEATAQDYDMYVNWQVPSDFDSTGNFGANGSIDVWGWRTDATNNSIEVTLYNQAGLICGTASQQAGAAAVTWNKSTLAGLTGTNCDIDAGQYVTLKIRMNADTNDFVRLGEIEINYQSTF